MINVRSGGSALLFAARAAVSLANGVGKVSDGKALRVAGSPVSGLIDGTSVFQSAAIFLISASLYPSPFRSRNAASFKEWHAEQTSE